MFRRSSTGATEGKAPGSQGTQAPDAPAKSKPPAEAGKGRPTPKRSVAEANRYRTVTGSTTSGRGPASTDGAARRKLTPEEKSQARAERNRRAEARQRGEEWAFDPRDRGPLKKLARDYVDAHRRPSEFYMYALILMVLALVTGSANTAFSSYLQLLLMVIVAVVVVDGFFLRRSLLKLAAERLPGESTRGLAFYAIMRALQLRRFRTPAPRLKPGDKY